MEGLDHVEAERAIMDGQWKGETCEGVLMTRSLRGSCGGLENG